jgi:drug/metabolite transporter (DMT)-like permease
MKKHRILALAALFVGFMGLAMMARTGRFKALYGADIMQLIGSGACIGAAMTVFIRSMNGAHREPAGADSKAQAPIS